MGRHVNCNHCSQLRIAINSVRIFQTGTRSYVHNVCVDEVETTTTSCRSMETRLSDSGQLTCLQTDWFQEVLELLKTLLNYTSKVFFITFKLMNHPDPPLPRIWPRSSAQNRYP